MVREGMHSSHESATFQREERRESAQPKRIRAASTAASGAARRIVKA
jgi:hypothetical protein